MKFSDFKTLAIAAATCCAGLLGAVSMATAATTATCPDDLDPSYAGTTNFILEVTIGDVSCVGFGDKNFHKSDLEALEGTLGVDLTLIDKSDNAVDGSDPDALNVVTGSLIGGLTGTFDIDTADTYGGYVIVLKGGGGQNDPGWGAFSFTDLSAVFEWWITDSARKNPNALSHVDLYGIVAPVPLPAAGFLLIGGLGGLAMVRRRKRS